MEPSMPGGIGFLKATIDVSASVAGPIAEVLPSTDPGVRLHACCLLHLGVHLPFAAHMPIIMCGVMDTIGASARSRDAHGCSGG
jgi:hypothetical protein